MPASPTSYLSMHGHSQARFHRFIRRFAPLLVLLLAWLFFTWNLNDRSLWVDEYATTQMTQGGIIDAARSAAADVHPPLYFLLLNVWILAAGDGDFAFRLFSAMLSLLAVALMLPLSRRLWPTSTHRWRVLTMLMLACAPALVLFGRMSRYYSLVLFLAMLSTWALLAALDGRRTWLAYIATILAMLYTFMPSIVLLPVQAVPVLASTRKRIWLAAAALVMLLFLPWLAFVAAGQVSTIQAFSATPFSRNAVGLILGVGAMLYTFSVGETLYPWSPFAIIGLAAIAASVVVALVKGGRPARHLGLMLAIGAVGMALIVNLLAVGTPFLNVPVRGLFLLPFAVLLVAMGLQQMKHRLMRYLVASGIAVAWIASLLNGYAGAQFMNPIYTTPSKEAVVWLRSQAQVGDLVIADWEASFDRYDAVGIYIDSANTVDIRAVLEQDAPAHVWWVMLGRDSKQIPALAETSSLLRQHYQPAKSHCLAAIDPLYRQFKDLALRRESYDCRLSVVRFDRITK